MRYLLAFVVSIVICLGVTQGQDSVWKVSPKQDSVWKVSPSQQTWVITNRQEACTSGTCGTTVSQPERITTMPVMGSCSTGSCSTVSRPRFSLFRRR